MSFAGAKVLSFESRRAEEMAQLIRNNGGDPFIAPALIEVPLEDNTKAFEFADELYAGGFEMVIFQTGVGARHLHRILTTRDPETRLFDALRTRTIVARGPKPVGVLREWGVPVTVSVPEPNTWRETLAAIEDRPERSLAVQEYGRPSDDLYRGLAAQGRHATAVPVYQWQLPLDTRPLELAITKLADGQFDVVLFTTSVQMDHLLQVAQRLLAAGEIVDALGRTFLCSIGPTCTEALREHGLSPALEPTHPKMGLLVREAAIAFSSKNVH